MNTKPAYCIREDLKDATLVDCQACALSNYGRDCQNNKIARMPDLTTRVWDAINQAFPELDNSTYRLVEDEGEDGYKWVQE